MRKYSAWYVGLSINTYILEFWARGFSPKLAHIELKGMSLKVPFKYIVNRYKLHDREYAEHRFSHISSVELGLYGVVHPEQVMDTALTVDKLDVLDDFFSLGKEPRALEQLDAYCRKDAALFTYGICGKASSQNITDFIS